LPLIRFILKQETAQKSSLEETSSLEENSDFCRFLLINIKMAKSWHTLNLKKKCLKSYLMPNNALKSPQRPAGHEIFQDPFFSTAVSTKLSTKQNKYFCRKEVEL